MAFVRPVSLPEARAKIYRYCAYQERCHQEVRNKLYEYGLPGSEVEQLITDLITEGYLNEERFARSYAGGKFRMKNWGRLRIIRELEWRNITPYCIKGALTEIDEEDYLKALRQLIEKKASLIEEENVFVKRDKLAGYAIQKGFEPELVWGVVRDIIR